MTGKQRLAIASVLGAFALLLAVAMQQLLKTEASAAGIGVRAPGFTALTLDEPAVEKSLDDYRGKVVLLNVWATWCGPCRVEMPSIEKLHQSYGPKGLSVVAVSVDEPGMAPQIRSFAQEFGLTFEILHDPEGQLGNVPKAFNVTGYPVTVIIGRDGVIRRKLLGAHDWNSAENRALIERLLKEKV
jgi:cytochrome c biogenesis protein CcmG/thiol:disulfide interchange protein DsbE